MIELEFSKVQFQDKMKYYRRFLNRIKGKNKKDII